MTAAHKASMRIIGWPRWWSMIAYEGTPAMASGMNASTTLSPLTSSGAPAPRGIATLIVVPLPGPPLTRTSALPQGRSGSERGLASGQGSGVMPIRPYALWLLSGCAGIGVVPPGHRKIMATAVSTIDGMITAITTRRVCAETGTALSWLCA